MKIVKFSKEKWKKSFFEIVEFPCFSNENVIFHTFLGVKLQQIGADGWH